MNRLLPAFLSLLLLLTTACVTHRDRSYVGHAGYLLAEREQTDGGTERYVLDVPARGSRVSLRRFAEHEQERPFLGLRLLELDKQRAERRGLQPYTGLLVEGTDERSAARQAGVRPGDLLVSLGDRKTIYLTDVAEVEARLQEGQQLAAQLRRGDEEVTLELTTRMLREVVTDVTEVPLESVPSQKAYMGVSLRSIPAAWCERIYGTERNAILVADVETGSPAWLAGLRRGDIIDRVDGMPTPPLTELCRTVAQRGAAGQSIRLLASRGRGTEFEARVELSDYQGETNAWIPLVFSLENGVHRDRWSLGPFGLLMSNRNSYLPDSSTRAVTTRNVFSALLGLFRVETSPSETEVRLLWLIHFDT